MADQGNLDSKTARDLEEEDAVDQWVSEIDKWVRRVDRDMGEGTGIGAPGEDAGDGVGSPADSTPGPAN